MNEETKIQRFKEYELRCNKTYPKIEIINIYYKKQKTTERKEKRISYICTICGNSGDQNYYNFIKSGCKECNKIKSEEDIINTHNHFVNRLKNKHPNIYNSITFLTYYKYSLSEITVKTKYGICRTSPNDLLNGSMPDIVGAINKTKYFKEKLKDKNVKLYNKILYFTSEYIRCDRDIYFMTKFGECKMIPSNMLSGGMFSIFSAVDKTKYFINKSNIAHRNKYNYSKTIYKYTTEKVCIICPEHGEFLQRPNDHYSAGCYECGKKVNKRRTHFNKEKAKISKDKRLNKNAMLYIIKCTNKDESFYKIGVTTRTLKKRFSDNGKMPYNYIIVRIYRTNLYDAEHLEYKLHKLNKPYQRIPSIGFRGKTECFWRLHDKTFKVADCFLEQLIITER